ncbi:hypothetical protein [Halomonas alimentaria]|uniref:DUF5666 domain-containing protein n=1 Tax=Halomonas alimentaria TaxID=147248 RepID=A0A7X4W2T3_9GAMM|nr:hypothetical protein [Halomonas alimentaria]NAW33269.1 hypothetical protein [Halomonas alimentaria]
MKQIDIKSIRRVLCLLFIIGSLVLSSLATAQGESTGLSTIVRLDTVSSSHFRAEGRVFRLTQGVDIYVSGERATPGELEPGKLVRIVFQEGELVLVEQIEEAL